jgi:hypothetical protein
MLQFQQMKQPTRMYIHLSCIKDYLNENTQTSIVQDPIILL